MTRRQRPIERGVTPEELARVEATLADLRRAELVTPTGVRPVEDVQAPTVSPSPRSAPDKHPRTGQA